MQIMKMLQLLVPLVEVYCNDPGLQHGKEDLCVVSFVMSLRKKVILGKN